MKRLTTIFLFFCLSACIKAESSQLSGRAQLDSSGVLLKATAPLRNVEKAKIVVVIDNIDRKRQKALLDSCGSPALLLTADVETGEGRRIVFSGHGASPCDAGPPPITETIDLRYTGAESLPVDRIRSIRLRSSKPVTLQSVEWETWKQGL